MIGSPLAANLMKYFAAPTSVGVMQTFVVMALVYFVFMMAGAFGYRVPETGWKSKGWTPPPAQVSNAMITQRHVHVKKVWGIPQFWLIWMVLCMNVSAGIGVIGIASPMLQEVFGGSLLGVTQKFGELDKMQLAAIATVAAGFTALLSLFNIGGRFFWASLPDKMGRKMTYIVFFVLGGLLPATAWPEKTGTVSNTHRMVQMGKQAVTPPGQAKPDLWIIQQLAGRLGLTWNYTGEHDGVAAVCEEMRQAMHASISGITRERLERESSVIYPCLSGDDAGETTMFIDKFPTADGRVRLVPAAIIRPMSGLMQSSRLC